MNDCIYKELNNTFHNIPGDELLVVKTSGINKKHHRFS